MNKQKTRGPKLPWPKTVMPERSTALRFYDNAACAYASPELFESHWTSTAVIEAALAYCRSCPVVDLCMEIKRPVQCHLDGVCAARVWENGTEIPWES